MTKPQSQRARAKALERVILWALGEGRSFPVLPEDWPARKFYWRGELRRKLDRALKVPEK